MKVEGEAPADAPAAPADAPAETTTEAPAKDTNAVPAENAEVRSLFMKGISTNNKEVWFPSL